MLFSLSLSLYLYLFRGGESREGSVAEFFARALNERARRRGRRGNLTGKSSRRGAVQAPRAAQKSTPANCGAGVTPRVTSDNDN